MSDAKRERANFGRSDLGGVSALGPGTCPIATNLVVASSHSELRHPLLASK